MDDKIIIIDKVHTNDNIDDLLTKSIPGWKSVKLRSRIIYSDIPNTSWKAS